jgi:hypothetical protein
MRQNNNRYKMTFKEFIKIDEEQSGTDKGMMGFPLPSSVRKPSDGQPFKNLGSVAGATPRGGSASGGIGAGPMMMKKKMKKN